MSQSVKRTAEEQRKLRRSRLYFIFGAIIIAVFIVLFSTQTTKALYVRSQTGAVFNTYVISHHIGTADISDDASGFQGDFCVLHVNKLIPTKDLMQQAMSLASRYYDLDGGTNMSIVAMVNGKNLTQASTVYEASSNTLMMTFNDGHREWSIDRKVKW